jgi:Protein of unknown function (DUF1257)
MSHLTRVRTTLADPALLAEALRELGFDTVEVHDRPQPLRAVLGSSQQAEVIVRWARNPGVRRDFGFARSGSGSYDLVLDDMDRNRFDAAWLARLTQAYGYAATLRYADQHGYEVLTEETEQDGTRRLTLRRVT